MPSTPDPRQRLAEQMEARRLELGLRWQDVAEAAGVSLKTLHSARTGKDVAPLTRRSIAEGLQWTPDSVDRILAGADPLASAEPATGPHRLPHLYDPALEPFLEEVRNELAEAMRAYGPGFTGDQAFPRDGLEAEAWDTLRLTPDESMRQIAWLRLIAAERDQRQSGSGRETGLWRT